jgi:hypothetical protein
MVAGLRIAPTGGSDFRIPASVSPWCQTPCLQWEAVLALCVGTGSVCASSEEPGAVVPHAGICEGGTG